MIARNCLIIAVLILFLAPCVYAQSPGAPLPNGIRLFPVTAEPGWFELFAAYHAGLRVDPSAEIYNELSSSIPARALALAAYGCGGRIQFFNDVDRTGFYVRVPEWARSVALEQVPGFFRTIAVQTRSATKAAVGPEADFRARVDYEIRLALLGPAGLSEDPGQIFNEAFGTDRAFVGMSGEINAGFREALAAIPARLSKSRPPAISALLPAERTLKFSPEFPTGAVILAAPVPTVYYKDYYSMLLLDRVLRRMVSGKSQSSLPLVTGPYYYKLEIAVPAGQFSDSVQENLLQELQRLTLARPKPEDLEAARKEAAAWLESAETRFWFESEGMSDQRTEGLQWIKSLSADDVRGAARDLLSMNHVLASWTPAARQTRIEVESLAPSSVPAPATGSANTGSPAIPLSPFPAHTHVPKDPAPPERLASGVFLAKSDIHAVFLAGGTLTRLDKEPDADTLRRFQIYRPDRILVFAPAASLDQVRRLWSGFAGNKADTAPVVIRGNVSTADLPALFVLKNLLDRKLIESGMWNEITLRISADVGSTMLVSDPAVQEWIRAIAAMPGAPADFEWAREAAFHHLDEFLPDLQSLIWERDPGGAIPGVESVSAAQLQDIARKYF